jgi:hypothetical protein
MDQDVAAIRNKANLLRLCAITSSQETKVILLDMPLTYKKKQYAYSFHSTDDLM